MNDHYQKLLKPLIRFNIETHSPATDIETLSGLILDKGRTAGESAVLQVQKGVLTAYGYTDLNYQTSKKISQIGEITELNIGHFFISESIFFGIASVLKKFNKILKR